MKAEELRERQDELLGWKINVVSYRLGGKFFCVVYNVDPGARLTREEGATREAAESKALEKAGWYVSRSGYRRT